VPRLGPCWLFWMGAVEEVLDATVGFLGSVLHGCVLVAVRDTDMCFEIKHAMGGLCWVYFLFAKFPCLFMFKFL